MTESELLDEIWAEGGAIVDWDRHTLRWFGGEDVNVEIPLRRLYLRLLSNIWQGWQVRWSHEGVAELADYIGIPRRSVLDGASESPQPLKLEFATKFITTVASFHLEGSGIRIFPLRGRMPHYLYQGPQLCGAALEGKSVEDLAIDVSSGIRGGFHVDGRKRLIEFWSAIDQPDAEVRTGHHWRDWTVTWHRDRFEFHGERTEGRLRFEPQQDVALLERIRSYLLMPMPASVVPPMEERRAVFDSAIAGMKTQSD